MKNITKQSEIYKKLARKRFYERQIENCRVLVADKQIKKCMEGTHAKEIVNLFRKLTENDQTTAQMEFCTLTDNLFVIILMVILTVLVSVPKCQQEIMDNICMKYIRYYKTFYSSGYAVVKIIQISLVQHTTNEYLNWSTRSKR